MRTSTFATTVAFSSFALAACSSNGTDTTSSGSTTSTSTTSTSMGGAGSTSSTAGTSSTGGGGAGCGSTATPGPGLVVTEYGAVQGAASGATFAYKGIPYAAPPVGDLRWKAPVEPSCYPSTLMATAFGPKCAQLDATSALVGSEDCLSLNVWTPSGATDTSKLPVLFFVHGGGNVEGSSAETTKDGKTFLYDGEALATAQNAVVVTINYRLNVFGWLTIGELDGENAHKASGNYATLDQIAALGWVQRNIAKFGGDPAHVLLFGESAGGENVCTLIASPLAAGLFSAAAMESGGCFAFAKTDAQTFGATVVQAAGCASASDKLACLRALSTDQMAKAVPGVANVAGTPSSYQANVDGYVLTDQPRAAISAGKHNHVPWIIGTNKDETNIAVPKTMTDSDYTTTVNQQFGALAQQVLDEYPIADYGTGRSAYVALTTDLKFTCSARKVLRAVAAHQSEPVYRYVFTHALDNGGAALKALGAYHGFELLWVFDHLNASGYVPSMGESDLAKAMGSYWTNLAAKGDPTSSGEPTWAKYDAAQDNYLGLDDTIGAATGVRTAQCDFWDQLLPDL